MITHLDFVQVFEPPSRRGQLAIGIDLAAADSILQHS
jgi:hypothetical protein